MFIPGVLRPTKQVANHNPSEGHSIPVDIETKTNLIDIHVPPALGFFLPPSLSLSSSNSHPIAVNVALQLAFLISRRFRLDRIPKQELVLARSLPASRLHYRCSPTSLPPNVGRAFQQGLSPSITTQRLGTPLAVSPTPSPLAPPSATGYQHQRSASTEQPRIKRSASNTLAYQLR